MLDPDEGKQRELQVWAILLPVSFKEHRDKVEAIEGELVWEIRNRTGKWPFYQNEIHFNNDNKEANMRACEIFKKMK